MLEPIRVAGDLRQPGQTVRRSELLQDLGLRTKWSAKPKVLKTTRRTELAQP